MPSTLIFGGSGQVARHITRILVSQEGHTVHSIIRKQEQVSEISALGAKPIVQSIEDSSVQELSKTIKNCSPDVVVWAAGAGGGPVERTQAVDRDGAIKSFDATAQAGVKRYIIVSAIDVRDRENKPTPEWYQAGDKDRSDRTWGTIGEYMKAKFAADTELVSGNSKRKLDYTIVRPGGLKSEAGVGTVTAGRPSLMNGISREDVARVVVECIKNPQTAGLAFDVSGGDTPIAEAVKKVADDKIDTFKAYM